MLFQLKKNFPLILHDSCVIREISENSYLLYIGYIALWTDSDIDQTL